MLLPLVFSTLHNIFHLLDLVVALSYIFFCLLCLIIPCRAITLLYSVVVQVTTLPLHALSALSPLKWIALKFSTDIHGLQKINPYCLSFSTNSYRSYIILAVIFRQNPVQFSINIKSSDS